MFLIGNPLVSLYIHSYNHLLTVFHDHNRAVRGIELFIVQVYIVLVQGRKHALHIEVRLARIDAVLRQSGTQVLHRQGRTSLVL
jgi:hypothetical protein